MKQDSNEIKKTILNIVKVSSSNLIKLFSGVLIGFLLPRIIGKIDYGYYKTLTLYTSYIGLFALGITDGIYLKFCGKKYDELDKEEFRAYTFFYIIIQVFFSIVLVVASIFLDQEYRFILVCFSLLLIGSNLTGYYQIISQMTGRFREFSFRIVLQSVLLGSSVFILWIINKFCDITLTYHIYSIITCVINIFLTGWYCWTYRDITFGKRKKFTNFRPIFELMKTGIPLLVANLCSSFILTIDRQFVNVLFDKDVYASYAFAYNMLSLITTATSAISIVIFPIMKRSEKEQLISNYSIINSCVLVIIALCLTAYFPLVWFVNWFLPQYADSLVIFRIIMPSLLLSSSISIVIHNYYKNENKETLYFIISIFILILSVIVDLVAYFIFKTTISISIVSVAVMLIWYFAVENYFVRRYKVKCGKNIFYILSISAIFYLVSSINTWWIELLIYLPICIILSILLFKKDFIKFITICKGKGE